MEVKFRFMKGEKNDVYSALKKINDVGGLNVLPVRHEKLLVATKHRYM